MALPTQTRRGFLRNSATLLAGAGVGALLRDAAMAAPNAAPNGSTGGLTFPPGFHLGVASAAYQIEGAWNADGKGESIWDRWSHAGRGEVTGDVACDHYHRCAEDVALLKQIGVTAYRFSISWPRIFPNGDAAVNPQGVSFYRNLIYLLKEARITPVVTLYHWDLPQKLEDAGGWTNRETVDHFDAYARLIFREFGRDVGYWITFNEPWVTAFAGYWLGSMAPGAAT